MVGERGRKKKNKAYSVSYKAFQQFCRVKKMAVVVTVLVPYKTEGCGFSKPE